ncbi:beta strand repeat-containing protein, partial [Candidatus Electronema sp. JM]|uniref:beta strand repeat-containing protein n=1 Tax=Candidatus Electronema sp. JM TaxID=3401571 RepID=UPI003AA8A026
MLSIKYKKLNSFSNHNKNVEKEQCGTCPARFSKKFRRKYKESVMKTLLKNTFSRSASAAAVLLAALLAPLYSSALAAANLTVTPITWGVIGLDSNNVTVGPNDFPVGVRVCNTSTTETANNVKSGFVFDNGSVSTDPYAGDVYINLRPGTFSSYTSNGINLAPAPPAPLPPYCYDFYYEAEVKRDPAAYDKTRNYHITASADNAATISTPTPRTIYVEHLVSQFRNYIPDVKVATTEAGLASVAPGGTMTLMVGNTYYIQLVGKTATQGYEQIESFLNIPNTVFQVLSAKTTYSAATGGVTSPSDKLYGNACTWEADPNSPNYRSCLSTGKAGGDVTVTYQVKILGMPSGGIANPVPLHSLIYDFSGSSYHYNGDFSAAVRYANIVDSSKVGIAKSFSPNPTNVNGISALTITLTNSNSGAISGFNFTDPLPSGMKVANPPNASTTSCGTPTFAPIADATSISFANGTVAANGSCTIKVNVTPDSTGTFNNTTAPLYIDSVNTTKTASATLDVNTSPTPASPICGVTMAYWDMGTTAATVPPNPTAVLGGNVTSAAAQFIGATGAISSRVVTNPSNLAGPPVSSGTGSWETEGYPKNTPPVLNTDSSLQFNVTSNSYSNVTIQVDSYASNNWVTNNYLYIWSSTDGTTWTPISAGTEPVIKSTWARSSPHTAAVTGETTYFRISAMGANSIGAKLNFDDIRITGCIIPTPPAIEKNFLSNPIPVNGVSTLTFTLSNSNPVALNGVNFTDALPNGLKVAATPTATTTCGGTPTWTPAADDTSLTFGSPTGATIPANGSCTVSVNVTGTAARAYQNVSGFISSINGGTNIGATGTASASLTIIAPPSIDKLFSPDSIVPGGTSNLLLTISNPNQNDPLTGVTFIDAFPLGMTVASPLATSLSGCGSGSLQDNGGGVLAEGDAGIKLTGATIAGGGTCTVTVKVTASGIGSYVNNVGSASSANGGTGKAADPATLTVKAPSPSIALLKQVASSPAGPWSSNLSTPISGPVYYRFYIENTGDVPLNPATVADPSTVVGPLLAGCTWKHDTYGSAPDYLYTGTASLAAPIQLPVAAPGLDPSAYCIVGPVGATGGTNNNTATVSGVYGGTGYTDSSTATYATTALSLVKSVTQTSFSAAGDTLSYNYLVKNTGYASLRGPVTVADDKTTVTCPAVSTVGDGDDWLDPNEQLTCTATYIVTPADVTAGAVTNTATASASGVSSNTDSVTVPRLPDFTVAKTDDVSGTVPVNGTFNWTITVSNISTGSGTFADGQAILSDALPGVAGYYPQGALTVTNGATAPTGTINCSIAGTTLQCLASGAVTFPKDASFSVTFVVTPTAAGTLPNTAVVDPNNNVAEIVESNNSGSDTLTVPPTITAVDDTAATPPNTPVTTAVTTNDTNVGGSIDPA